MSRRVSWIQPSTIRGLRLTLTSSCFSLSVRSALGISRSSWAMRTSCSISAKNALQYRCTAYTAGVSRPGVTCVAKRSERIMPRNAWHTLPAWPRASQKLSKGRAHADEQQAFKARCKRASSGRSALSKAAGGAFERCAAL